MKAESEFTGHERQHRKPWPADFKGQRLAVAIVALGFTAPLLAQDQADEEGQGGSTQLLNPLEVTAEQIQDPRAPVSGYQAQSSLSATKTATPLTETPQAISVITSEQMRDQGATTVQETLRYSAGVGAETFGLDSRGDWATIRGFDPVVYLDGLQKTFGFYQSPRQAPYTLERIEIIRGPASTLYGRSSAGGIINLVSKRPQAEQRTELGVQVGNYSRRQLNLDSTGPLTEDGTLLYRVVAVGRDSETQVNRVGDDRLLFSPSLTWRPNDQFEWTLIGNIQEDESGSTTQFLPIDGTLRPAPFGLPDIPVDVFVSEPGFDEYDTREKALTSLLTYHYDDTWTFRQNLRYAESEVSYQTLYGQFPPVLEPNGDLQRVAYANKPELDALTVDNQVQARFGSERVEHLLLFGVDYQHAVSNVRSAFDADAGPINLYNPVYGNFTPFTQADYNDLPENTVSQLGFYLQDQITLADRWITVLSLRHDEVKNKTAGSDAQEDDAVTGRVAFLYKADNGLSPYISYAESFNPIVGVNAFGESFKPLEGEQIELGLKYQPPGSNSLFTAAIYDLRQKNTRTPDPDNPANQIQTGESRARGLELEAQAALNPNWDLIAAYSYTDTEVLEGNNEGNRLPSVPEHMASLWSQHGFSIGGTSGFSAGVGARYVGASYGGNDSLKTPGVTLFDAMLGYGIGNWDFNLTVNNIEDETYFTTCLVRGDCFVGTQRTVIGSATVAF